MLCGINRVRPHWDLKHEWHQADDLYSVPQAAWPQLGHQINCNIQITHSQAALPQHPQQQAVPSAVATAAKPTARPEWKTCPPRYAPETPPTAKPHRKRVQKLWDSLWWSSCRFMASQFLIEPYAPFAPEPLQSQARIGLLV